jgi:hypothetical protein
LAPLPVLISVPTIATGSRPLRGRVRRRRLRREVRVVGYALLILMPLTMAFATFAGDRRPFLSVNPPAESSESTDRQASISLSPLEPIVAADRQAVAPVILPGVLLPVDASEESSDGGH